MALDQYINPDKLFGNAPGSLRGGGADAATQKDVAETPAIIVENQNLWVAASPVATRNDGQKKLTIRFCYISIDSRFSIPLRMGIYATIQLRIMINP